MNWTHTTETLRTYTNGGNTHRDVVKHTFGFKVGGKYLVVTWCWC